jgi:tetratricopeptide (TPR) repeat protein
MYSIYNRLIACAAVGLLLVISSTCGAERYALVIGIDIYEDTNHINPLGGAAADARAIAAVLRDVAHFEQVYLLSSDTEEKPSRKNILFRLGEMKRTLKSGDTLLFYYAGHGFQIEDSDSYSLLPWDVDGRNDLSLRESSIDVEKVVREFSRIPLEHLITLYDMCRTDPRKTGRDIAPSNPLTPAVARDLIVPYSPVGKGPRSTFTIAACSAGQRSWEWIAKGRGFFSYYLEQGLKGEAADSEGVVRLSNLKLYLEKEVPAAVFSVMGVGSEKEQKPWTKFEGSGDPILVHVSGRKRPDNNVSETDPTKALFDKSYENAVALWSENKIEKALESARDALRYRPASESVWALIGELQIKAKRLDEAEAAYRKCVTVNVVNKYSWCLLADFLEKYKPASTEPEFLYGTAAKLESKRVSKNSEWPPGVMLYIVDAIRWQALFENDDNTSTKAAIPSVSGASEDQNYFAHTRLFSYIIKRDGRAKAEKFCEESVASNPKDPFLLWSLTQSAESNSAFDIAERLYLRLISRFKLHHAGFLAYSQFLSRRGKYEEAEKQLRKSMELSPKSASASLELAGLLVKSNRLSDEIEGLCQSALSSPVLRPRADYYLGVVEMRIHHDLAKAEQLFDSAQRSFMGPRIEYGALCSAYSQCLSKLGKTKRAIEMAKQAYIAGVKDPWVIGQLKQAKRNGDKDSLLWDIEKIP